MNNTDIANEKNKHLSLEEEIAQAVEKAIDNHDYTFYILGNDLFVNDNDSIVTMLSNHYLMNHNLNDIISNIKIAILINEIKVRFDNYCLDDEQINAMLSIVTGLNY